MSEIIEKLKEVLKYDENTGIFKWRKDIYRCKNNSILVKKGDIAGCLNHDGYRYIKYNNKRYSEHRLAYMFVYNKVPTFVDHIDGDKQNNKINNLRECTKNQNGQNRTKMINNTSGFKGVHYDKRCNKFAAQIRNNKKLEWLGYFEKAEDAAIAYNNRAVKIFGEFSNLNIIDTNKLFLDNSNIT